MDLQSSVYTNDPAPAVSNQESSEGLSVITAIHLIYIVGAHEKLVFINTHPSTFSFSVSLQALKYIWVRTCSPLRKQASCTLHLLKHQWQKPAQEYASVSRMAHTANLNSFHMLPKNCDQMPLANKWGDCLAYTEKFHHAAQSNSSFVPRSACASSVPSAVRCCWPVQTLPPPRTATPFMDYNEQSLEKTVMNTPICEEDHRIIE